MKANRTLFVMGALAFILPLHADQLTPEEAIARLGQNRTVRIKSASAKKVASQLTLVHTTTDGDRNLMYVMNREGDEGFVILGADDCAPALIGYTDKGGYEENNLPDNFKNWMASYAQSISTAIDNGRKMASQNVQHAAIEPLVTTEWDQLLPYNKKCDDRGTNFGVYTGCVATAMAQVMNYHKYPAQGMGENTYTFPVGKNTYTGHSNFSEHTYDWDNMLNTYASYGNTAAQEDAVATLMHDCGVSVNMDYNTASSGNGSGASNNLVAQALVKYFGYDRSVRCVTRTYFSDAEWEEMMIAELEAKRPIIYAGASVSGGGHEFVMDGYDGNGRFHFNWGWSGSCNGFFLINGDNALNPYEGNSNYGSWGDDPNYGFNKSQAAVIGIQPDKGTEDTFVGMGCPADYSLSYSEYGYRSQYQYVYGYFWNTSVFPISVYLGLKYVNVNNPNEVYYDASPIKANVSLESYMMSYYVFLKNIVTPGKYYVYPVFKDANDPYAEWQDMTLDYGHTNIPVFTWTASEPALYLPEMATIGNGDAINEEYEVKAKDAKLHFTLKATSGVSRELQFELYVPGSSTKVKTTYLKIPDMKEGESREIVCDISDLLKDRTAGDYQIKIRTTSDYELYPSYNSRIPIRLVDAFTGDLNNDGATTLADLTTLIKILPNGTVKNNPGRDINRDGILTNKDVNALIKRILNK